VTTIEDFTPAQPSGSDGIANILNMLLRRRYLIIGIVVVCTALTTLVTSYLKPLYRVELNLLIDPHNAQVNDVQTLATQTGFFDANLIRNQIAVLWSEDLIREVVTTLDLQDTPDFRPTVSRYFRALSPDNPMDRPLIWLRSFVSNIVSSGHKDAAPESPDAKINAAITRYLGQISILNDGHSYVLTLHVNASDPALAVKIANAHARAYLEHQIASKERSVKDANASVSSELDALAAKLKASEEALRAFRESAAISSSDSPTAVSQQIGEMTSQLTGLRSQVSDKEVRLHALQTLLDEPGVSSGNAGSFVISPAYDRLRAKEQDLLQQQAEVHATYGDAYPKLTQIRLELVDTQAQLRAEIGRMVKAATVELSAIRSQEDQLVGAIRTARSGVEHQESAAPNLHFLEAEVDANKTVYTAFLTRVRQLTAQEALQQPDGRIIGEAIMPTHPYFPNAPLIIAGGFVGSLVAALGLALLMGFASRGFDTLAQVEKACDAPGLGIIPLVRKPIRRAGMHGQIAAMPRSHYAERVRMIRNSLALAVNGRRHGQVILLTSSLPEEGKTSCAVSLSASLVSAGRKTLLIDADLRKPGVGRILGADPQQPGLGDLLEAKATIDEVIQVDARTGLHFIAADRASLTAQDHIDFDLIPDFFDAVRDRYDYIFIDSPPLIAVSDTLWLARLADAVIFLVRWQRTPRAAVRATIQKLRDTGTAVTGVLLTCVDINKAGSLTPNDFDYYLKDISKYYASS